MAGTAKPRLVELSGDNKTTAYQLVMAGSKIRFCFNPPDLEKWPYDGQLLCRTSGAHRIWSQQPAIQSTPTASLPVYPIRMRDISLRSPREVFYFLGRVVRQRLGGAVPAAGIVEAYEPHQAPRPLINIVCAPAETGSEPLAIATHRGRTCHIPRNDGSHSAHVLQYL